MRYYDLDNGKVRGSYAVPQPGKTLHLLDDAPNEESMRDGVPGSTWIPDQEKIDARLAKEAREAKTIAAKNTLKNTQVSSINNVPGLRDAVIKILDALDIEYKT